MLACAGRQNDCCRKLCGFHSAVAVIDVFLNFVVKIAFLSCNRAVTRNGSKLNAVFKCRKIHFVVIRSNAVIELEAVGIVGYARSKSGLIVIGENVISVDKNHSPVVNVHIRIGRLKTRIGIFIILYVNNGQSLGFCGDNRSCFFENRNDFIRKSGFFFSCCFSFGFCFIVDSSCFFRRKILGCVCDGGGGRCGCRFGVILARFCQKQCQNNDNCNSCNDNRYQ